VDIGDILVAKLAQAVSAEILKYLSASASAVQPALLPVKENAVYLG